MDDIDISSTVGVLEDKPFSGTFNGGGHTITATINDNSDSGTAPFRYIKNATIKNLTVAGTITSNQRHMSGLVGFADSEGEGKNLIEDCAVTATLNVNTDYVGGIVGHGLSSKTTIRGCVFAGTMNASNNPNVGVIWGWSDSGTPTLENCLEAGTYTGISKLHPMGLQGGSGSITNCYYVKPQIGSPTNACTVSGAKQAYTITSGTGVTMANSGEVRITYDASRLTFYNGGLKYGEKLYAACDDVVSLTLSHDTNGDCNFIQYVASGGGTLSTQDATSAILTMPASNVTIRSGWAIPTDGSGNHLISDENEWDVFCTNVESGMAYSGQTVKLMADISVSAMAGASEANSFQGTFDGGGHMLTFTKGSAESAFVEENCAPFRYVKNATIQNLKVAGAIYTFQKCAAGLVARSYGTTNITGCQIGTVIHSRVYGDGTHGGIVAMPAGSTTTNITGCVYNGRLLTTTTNSTFKCGGFVGWSGDNTVTVAHSLYAPDANIVAAAGEKAINNGVTFVRGNTPTVETSCYYTETMGSAQGTHAYALATSPANFGNLVQDYGMLQVYGNGILYDGTYYVAPATVSLADNADNSTTISENNGNFANVTLTDRTLYKDGAWNTICLPFNLTLSGSPLDGAIARPLSAASISNEKTTLNLEFGDAVTELVAGTPYIIKWAKADDYVNDDAHNIVNPLFRNATIDATDRSYDNGESADSHVRFIGTYDGMSFYTKDYSYLFMGSENTLYYPSAGAGIGAQRAYFKIGEDGVWLTRALTAFDIDFGEGENVTGIISTSAETRDNEGWYTIDGRKFNGKPTVSGVYVNKGRKVLIK
jgi:hypothetical protein